MADILKRKVKLNVVNHMYQIIFKTTFKENFNKPGTAFGRQVKANQAVGVKWKKQLVRSKFTSN